RASLDFDFPGLRPPPKRAPPFPGRGVFSEDSMRGRYERERADREAALLSRAFFYCPAEIVVDAEEATRRHPRAMNRDVESADATRELGELLADLFPREPLELHDGGVASSAKRETGRLEPRLPPVADTTETPLRLWLHV